MAPVLEALRLRVDVDGVADLDGLTLASTGSRLLVVAAPRALFAACAGLVAPRHGELRVVGEAPLEAVRAGHVASAQLDPPLPASWTPLEYLTWSARLAGRTRGEAEDRARDAASRLKLDVSGRSRLRGAAVETRRAVVVAAALATGAGTLLLEDPLAGLSEEAARGLARHVVRATEGLRTVVFAARSPLSSPLALDADEALVLDGSRVVAQGDPAEIATHDRAYTVRLHVASASFGRIAERRGARVSGAGAEWTVDLGASLQVSDILDIAAAAETVVLELRPLTEAFG
jgi:ABC-2 type transport system ATP-binding protein